MKIYVIRLLLQEEHSNDDVYSAIYLLAEQRYSFSAHSGFDLLVAIVAALKLFPTKETIALLAAMQNDYKQIPGSEEIVMKINEALGVLEPQVRHNVQTIIDGEEDIAFESDPVIQQHVNENVRNIEKKIVDFLERDEVEAAGQLLYQQALEAAFTGEYEIAEKLRERLLEVNPMAMGEVIELGEKIEAEKTSSITTHHLAIWQELYDEMTTEEFNSIYYALRTENFQPGDTIIKAGEIDSNLYFLNSGFINMSCLAAGNDIFLRRMQPGEVLGGEQFFSPSVWTVNLRAITPVQLQLLNYDDWLEILEEFPGLDVTLQSYCKRVAKIPELLRMAGDDRREYPRYSVNLMTKNVLLDPYGKKGREFTGELIDISKNGLSFTIRINNKRNAKLLLGRQIVTTVLFEGEQLSCATGMVVGVRTHDLLSQNYSVHIKLSKHLDRVAYNQILTLSL